MRRSIHRAGRSRSHDDRGPRESFVVSRYGGGTSGRASPSLRHQPRNDFLTLIVALSHPDCRAADERRQHLKHKARTRRQHPAEKRPYNPIEEAVAKARPDSAQARVEAKERARLDQLATNGVPLGYQLMSFEEKVAMHYANGTLQEFLNSLRHG